MAHLDFLVLLSHGLLGNDDLGNACHAGGVDIGNVQVDEVAGGWNGVGGSRHA